MDINDEADRINTHERKLSRMTHVSPFTQQDNAILDRILESRRSVRSFAPDIPPKEDITRIIRAGLLAPYAAQAVVGQDFRRFFVFREDSPQLVQVAAIGKRQVKRMAEQLSDELAANPSLGDEAQGFVKRLERLAEMGVPGIGTAPYYIVRGRTERHPTCRAAITRSLSGEHVAEGNRPGAGISARVSDCSDGTG